MSNNHYTVTPSLRMPHQAPGVNRQGTATAAATGGGVDPAFLPALLGGLLAAPPVQDLIGQGISAVTGWLSDLF